MPRIDPLQLLKILSVLLAPNGGIKSQDEVPRLASLMTKFSKKLVSKCIYVSILKVTEPEMLVMWMSAGGWDLIYNWLNDGVQAKNWPLVNELVELLLVCPVDIERLKTNRCPKLIKTLSKNPDATEAVRQHAAEIVKKWLMVVNEVLTKQKEEAPEDAEGRLSDGPVEIVEGRNAGEESNSEADADSQLPVYRIIIRDGKEMLTEVSNKDRAKGVAGSLEDEDEEEKDDENDDDDDDEEFVLDGSKVLKSGAKGVAGTKRNLKVKKTLELDVANKASKVDKPIDGLEASTSVADQVRPSVVLNRNKSDPARDRRKDKMRQIRKDPDGDVYFESRPIADEKPSDKMKNKKVSGVKSSHASDKLKSSSKSGSSSVSGSGNSKSGVASKSGASAAQIKPIITKSPDISKLGKIPKKSKSDGGDKKDKVGASSDKKDKDAVKLGVKSEKDDSKSGTKKPEIKKPPAPPPPKMEKDSKKYNISVEPRKVAPGETRPKTVKTFNSKFRSTGLEEELPPPPQPKSVKKNLPTGGDKKPLKRISPPKEPQPPEKKPKTAEPVVVEAPVVPAAPSLPVTTEKEAKPVKPKMQLSDSFMDALNAATVMKEPRKRKRRMSGSKDPDKKDPSEPESPNQSPQSPALVKPNFKFYQDTLESDDSSKTGEEDKKKIKVEKDNEKETDDGNDSNSENRTPSPMNEVIINTEEEIKNEKNRQNSEGLRGVLIFAKLRKGPKKKVSWRGELEDIKFFELDENERVNVTKTFLDAKQMERIHERENFAIARKLTNEDVMEEKIRWKVLIPCDSPNLGVIPGNNSAEKEIQYAREKTVPAAFYFNKRLIPDSPAEPDLEIHATTDPTIIPLEDISGNEDSINDFTNTPWPESKNPSPPQQEPLMVGPPGPIMPAGPIPNFGPGPVGPAGPGFSPNSGPGLMGPGPGPGPVPNMGFGGFGGPPVPPFGPPQPGPPPGMGMMPPGDWRGPGQDMKGPGPIPPDMFGPPGPPGMMGPPGLLPPPDLPFGMQPPGPMPGPPDDMNFPGGPFNMNQGPGGPPNMFQGPPFQGNNGGNNNNNGGNNNNNQGGGNWYRSNGPGGRHDDDRGNDRGSRSDRGNYRNRDRGGRNEGRGSGGGSWRSGRGGGGDKWGGGGGGGGKNSICNNYARWGNCRSNNCPYRHPYKD